MRIPNFKKIKVEMEGEGFYGTFQGSFVHPNPRFYKYYWWIFWQGSPCDGTKFLSNNYRLPIKKAFDLVENLRCEQQAYWLYNMRYPRRDPDYTPFDFNAEKWRGCEWAAPFDEDADKLHGIFK